MNKEFSFSSSTNEYPEIAALRQEEASGKTDVATFAFVLPKSRSVRSVQVYNRILQEVRALVPLYFNLAVDFFLVTKGALPWDAIPDFVIGTYEPRRPLLPHGVFFTAILAHFEVSF